MFLIYVALMLVFLGLLCFIRYHMIPNSDWDGGAVILIFVGAVVAAASIPVTLIAYSTQLSDIEDLKKYTELERIYADKAATLTTEFATYLADTYPKHEKDIFKTISPEKVSIYMAKYPELQASKTLTALVEQISKLQNDRYQQQVNKAVTLKDMRFRLRNPWLFNSWIPKIQE